MTERVQRNLEPGIEAEKLVMQYFGIACMAN